MNHSHSERTGTHSLTVTMKIAAEPATVWRFMSEGQSFAAWIGAFGGQGPLEGTRIDPRVGGEVHVFYPGGHEAVGRITEMEPPRRILFTWGYLKETYGLPAGSSQVEITLAPLPEGTLVRLTHTGLPTEEARKGHLGGWKHYLSILAREASASHHSESAQRAFNAYFQAWSEPDGATRLRLLSDSCVPEVRVRTSFACTDDISQLSDHIAGGLLHMPGMSLRAEGPVQVMHGFARVRWTLRARDERAVAGGENFGILSLSGKLASVASFPDPKP